MNSSLSRRRFLKQANCAAVGTTGIFSSLLNLKMLGTASGANLPTGNDYKALICVFMDGGNDSFNMLTPYEQVPYDEYAAVRGELSLARDTLLPITDHDGTQYGLHASMPEMQALYNSDDLAFIANVGTLRERVTKVDVVNQFESAKIPIGLFSHSDQQMHWQTSLPDRRSSIGWGGRAADLLSPVNTRDDVAMNIALGGVNIFQTGQSASPYTVNSNSLPTLNDYETDAVFRTAVDSLLEQEYQNVLRRTYADAMRGALDTGILYREALEAAPDVTFTGSNPDVRVIAQTIAARVALGARRQTFFLRLGGWDFHDGLIGQQANQLRSMSENISALWTAIGDLGLQDDVVIFSGSDFGRSLTPNGNGTDHAWGGNQFVIGGQVKGGRIYGEYPETLALDSALDIDPGRGRIMPTVSTDEYFAELACWFGVSNADLPTVLPNIGRFYTPGSVTPPMGFLL